MGLDLVAVDHIADHRRHQREQAGEAERHEGRRNQDQPRVVRRVADPLEGIADHGDSGGDEKRPTFADLGCKPGDEGDNGEPGYRLQQA